MGTQRLLPRQPDVKDYHGFLLCFSSNGGTESTENTQLKVAFATQGIDFSGVTKPSIRMAEFALTAVIIMISVRHTPITEMFMSKSKDTKKETKKKPKLSLKEKRQLKKTKNG